MRQTGCYPPAQEKSEARTGKEGLNKEGWAESKKQCQTMGILFILVIPNICFFVLLSIRTSMEKTIHVIEKAQSEGLFSLYAIGEGIAALFYIEPVATFDLDIFIILPESSNPLVSLSPIYSWFSDRGYKFSQEQIVIEGIAVQLIPVYNDLVKDGVLDAAVKKYGNTPTRVLKPEYLIALMLQTYRTKDKERLCKFLHETAIDYHLLDSILLKYNLKTAFETFKEQFYGR